MTGGFEVQFGVAVMVKRGGGEAIEWISMSGVSVYVEALCKA